MKGYASTGLVFYLFGLFCAYWAQQTGRSSWLWFFLGWFFAPITGIFLVMKNAKDLRSKTKPRRQR
ncbi:hypothetical protein Poly30_11310 [Planctomycetes bacterium Poly30]|uniref:Uncharacterized protein n=1 Tax=Saltatorellus ferox TaxID=2528018 RepID=A0A518ENG8_9BACT|nr:hypothetical protein Poly30_11310 [Planctomycetes bacterium Poly30]